MPGSIRALLTLVGLNQLIYNLQYCIYYHATAPNHTISNGAKVVERLQTSASSFPRTTDISVYSSFWALENSMQRLPTSEIFDEALNI